MKHRRSQRIDIILLLCILLIFSCGISLLYGTSLPGSVVSHVDDKEVMETLQPLDVSHSVLRMSEYLSSRPFDQQMRTLNKIVSGQASALNPEEKVELGVELLAKRANVAEQKEVLDLLNKYPDLLKVPLLYIAVDKKQLPAVPMILNYYKDNAKELQNTMYGALVYAIKQNNLKNFTQILSSVGGISAQMGTQLVWDVLQENKNAQFIPVLAAQKADLNDGKEGKTPLVAAVEKNNVEMVRALLENKALPNKFIDPAIGTPLQRVQALERASDGKDATIELLLRKYGAKE